MDLTSMEELHLAAQKRSTNKPIPITKNFAQELWDVPVWTKTENEKMVMHEEEEEEEDGKMGWSCSRTVYLFIVDTSSPSPHQKKRQEQSKVSDFGEQPTREKATKVKKKKKIRNFITSPDEEALEKRRKDAKVVAMLGKNPVLPHELKQERSKTPNIKKDNILQHEN